MSDIQHRAGLLKALEGFTKMVELKSEVGSAIVTEYGARILGVFIGGSQNPFWVSSNLREAINKGIWNIGGNRLWISPERNFFYRRPGSFEEWFCQPSLDPGNWRIESSSDSSVTLEENLGLEDIANQTSINLSLSRRISLLGIETRRGLGCMVLRVREAMLAKGDFKDGINLWSLTQIRPGGTVLIPTRPKAKPINYFDEIPRDRLKVSSDHVSFRIDGVAAYKLGIRPEDMSNPGSSCIVYYMQHGKDKAFLLSMSTTMAPLSQEECLDVAKSDPNGPKGCVQSYNSGPDLRFGEMELHFRPAIRLGETWISYAGYDMEFFVGDRNNVGRSLRRFVKKPVLF